MEREFAMINTGLQHQPEYQALDPHDRLLLYVILSSEGVDLKGLGRCDVEAFAEGAGLPTRAVKDGLGNLEEAGFIARDQDSGLLLVRRWWWHTSLKLNGLSSLFKQLRDGRLGRALKALELAWLEDWLDRLSSFNGKTADDARRFAQQRIAEIESQREELAAEAAASARAAKELMDADPETRQKFAEILAIDINKRKEA
jgi:hypothetical protein